MYFLVHPNDGSQAHGFSRPQAAQPCARNNALRQASIHDDGASGIARALAEAPTFTMAGFIGGADGR